VISYNTAKTRNAAGKHHAHPVQGKNCYVTPNASWKITSLAWNDKARPSVTIADNQTDIRMWYLKNTSLDQFHDVHIPG